MKDQTEPGLAEVLKAMGCPEERCGLMAAQLEKRAGQLALEHNQTRDRALAHLLGLMRQGWAAKGRGF